MKKSVTGSSTYPSVPSYRNGKRVINCELPKYPHEGPGTRHQHHEKGPYLRILPFPLFLFEPNGRTYGL
ncbi:hypothetical protein CDAR_118551 [Caerostris darwini]|uniref:Uncharacterized protein n=1 Tax=Caerostris darwini TaxID=1538125 RepID=A0AAV4X0E1_9ARAC|nr:hypothetical protein CDAR_118551 [Caerostris darwini]